MFSGLIQGKSDQTRNVHRPRIGSGKITISSSLSSISDIVSGSLCISNGCRCVNAGRVRGPPMGNVAAGSLASTSMTSTELVLEFASISFCKSPRGSINCSTTVPMMVHKKRWLWSISKLHCSDSHSPFILWHVIRLASGRDSDSPPLGKAQSCVFE